MGRARVYEPEIRLSREAYRAWTQQQPSGRFERIGGVVVAMAPERALRALRKAAARDALLREKGLPCQVFPDGMTIEIGDNDYEPDAVLRCGDRLPSQSIAVSDPLVIVEVLSAGPVESTAGSS